MEGYINENRWVDLSKLPRKKHGTRICIDWSKSIGESLPFLYDGISGNMKILNYKKSNNSFVVYVDGYTRTDGDIIYLSTIQNCELKRLLTKKIIDGAPEMVKYLKDKNDAYKYTCQSNKYITIVCPICGREKQQMISNLYAKGFSCAFCSDGVSFPNKLMTNILRQLNVEFINEVTKAKDEFEWVGAYRYDFYFEKNNQKYFVEMDGGFHYADHFRSCKITQENDNTKDLLAQQHNIQMIRINCCDSSINNRFSFIQKSILDSELINILDLSIIDWDKAHKSALNNYIALASQYWSDGYPVVEISNIIGVSRHTICSYLKIATSLDMCNYTEKESRRRIKYIKFNKKRKPIGVYKDGYIVNVFQSITSLERESFKLYGIHMYNSNISKVCNGHLNNIYGYEFKHISYNEYKDLCLQFDPTVQNECTNLLEVI